MKYYTKFKAPHWDITLVGNADGISYLHMETGKGKRKFAISEDWKRNDEMFAYPKKQVQDYFAGKLKKFDITLNPEGTDFQKQVWQELSRIPFGQTRSYKDIATAIGNPNSCRAVGMANAKNPLPIIVPCHRVVGASGKLTGFAHGLDAKKLLLQLENCS